ncbi:MAG: tRNA pseudouridine(38-40) synthase TruA, partial [Oleibacter sp.]|nr:tRNA pseudouridine(38-40) synthase TruA [Thalassolituus sp.]
QAALEAAISKVANHPVEVVCAGRTDTGVHATRQVIHFDSPSARSDYGWMMGINTHLPDGVAVQWVSAISDDFHARYKAKARRYRYLIYNQRPRPALMSDQLTWFRYPLDAALMHEAAQHLIGEHDFTSFRAKDCQAKSPIKEMHHIRVERWGKIIMVELECSAFLYHMVRNIVGVLLPIGQGHQPTEWMKEILAMKNRNHLGVTAPGGGLYFVGVQYPEEFSIPSQPWGPVLLEPLLQREVDLHTAAQLQTEL